MAHTSKHKSAYHWLVVACCSGLIATAFGISVNCTGIFFIPVSESLGVGRGDIALYATIMSMVTALSNLFVGSVVKKVKLPVLLTVGGLLVSLSMASWSFATATWQLYIAAVAHGIGNGLISSVTVNIILSNWFNKSMGLAMGITFSFSGIAGALLNPLFQRIITSSGWQTAHNIAALLCALLVLPSVLLVRLDPREKGLLPYGGEGSDASTVEAEPSDTARAPGYAIAAFTMLLAGFVVAFCTGMGQHISGYGHSIGLSPTHSALLATAVMVGNVASKLLYGILSDKIGSKPSFIMFIAITIAGLAGLLALTGLGYIALVISAALLGFTYSLCSVGGSQVTRAYFNREDSRKCYAWMQTAGNLGSSIASAVIGYIYDFTASYSLAIVLCAVLSAVALSMMVIFVRKR